MYKERIANLMYAVKEEPDDMEFVESRVNTFTDYVGHVVWMEARMQRIEIEGLRGQDYRDAVEPLDRSRRSKHEVAMGAINQLNRLSKMHNLEPFYDGPVDHEHRNEVGDVIGKIVNEYFEGRDVGRLKQKDMIWEDDFAQAVGTIYETSSSINK